MWLLQCQSASQLRELGGCETYPSARRVVVLRHRPLSSNVALREKTQFLQTVQTGDPMRLTIGRILQNISSRWMKKAQPCIEAGIRLW